MWRCSFGVPCGYTSVYQESCSHIIDELGMACSVQNGQLSVMTKSINTNECTKNHCADYRKYKIKLTMDTTSRGNIFELCDNIRIEMCLKKWWRIFVLSVLVYPGTNAYRWAKRPQTSKTKYQMIAHFIRYEQVQINKSWISNSSLKTKLNIKLTC